MCWVPSRFPWNRSDGRLQQGRSVLTTNSRGNTREMHAKWKTKPCSWQTICGPSTAGPYLAEGSIGLTNDSEDYFTKLREPRDSMK